MRPIKKSQPGATVHYMDSCGNDIQHVINQEYTSYGDAKMPLVGDIGQYCSYCEAYRDVDALAVEHLAAKSKGGSETAWDNFALSCTVCNSCKGASVIDENYHWPHRNNTFLDFIYDMTGRIKVNPDLPPQEQEKAKNLLRLTHLNRFPDAQDKPSSKDYRWKQRFETWNLAAKYKGWYLDGTINESDVIEVAMFRGYWSIWFTVFSGIDAILQRLITDFPGTCAECFDATNHYVPIARHTDD